MTSLTLAIVVVFIIGYFCIAIESVTKVNKAAVALLIAVAAVEVEARQSVRVAERLRLETLPIGPAPRAGPAGQAVRGDEQGLLQRAGFKCPGLNATKSLARDLQIRKTCPALWESHNVIFPIEC